MLFFGVIAKFKVNVQIIIQPYSYLAIESNSLIGSIISNLFEHNRS